MATTYRELTIHVNMETGSESSFQVQLEGPLDTTQLARNASRFNLFVMEYPSEAGPYAYIDTYSDLLRFGKDDEKAGLSAIMSITAIRNTSPTQYRLSTIVNPFSFLTPDDGNMVQGYYPMVYKSFIENRDRQITTFEVEAYEGTPTTPEDPTLLSFSALGMGNGRVKKYLTPQYIGSVKRPQVVGWNFPDYNTKVYIVGNYTYETLPVAKSN